MVRASGVHVMHTFHLTAGVYRQVQIQPLDGDVFIGDTATVLSGAVVLSSFQHTGSLWIANNQYAHGQAHGECATGFAGCVYPEDLYFDNKPLQRVTSQSGVKPGAWYFDYSKHRIVLANNPAGHVVELSVARSAFAGSASNVTIENMTIEKYAVPAQAGAVGDQMPGYGWHVLNNQIRLNHGAGVHVKSGSTVVGNSIHDNGQEGFAAEGSDITFAHNEISNNNFAGFDQDWEAGGGKCAVSHSVLVQNNFVHDNRGPGLWADIDSQDITYDSNVVQNNTGEGIKYEISYGATIKNNTVSGNGSRQYVWLWGSQILIQNSQNVDVYGNHVIVPSSFGNAIGIIYQDRGTGALGPYDAKNNNIHDNDITYESGAQGRTGAVTDFDPTALFGWSNVFDHNTYHVADIGAVAWEWNGSGQTWPGFRSYKCELSGSLDTQSE